jgi:tripartite-type tricarboxylate transporter receptor subunit TctC
VEKLIKTTAIGLTVALGAAGISTASNAAWPEKAITMMVAFKAGGGADTLGRIVANAISKKHGWKFIVKNKSGAGGAVMAKALKREKADGYTIGMSVSGPFAFDTIYKPKIGFTANDFTYLGSIAKFQMAILAMKDKGWKTLAEAMKAG